MERSGSAAGSRPTILVVDDNDANRALAMHTLQDEGYRVVLAPGGAEGIARFEQEHPDCVLLDIRMPGVDGFAVCAQIRALPLGAETSIVFLTALRDLDTFDRALRAGGDDFLTKPIRPSELLVRVQTALKLKRLGVELREHYEALKRQRNDVLRLQLQRERLMAFVVHDLKNPVGSLDLHAQLILRDPAAPADVRDSAAHIRAAARQLGRMILNLLDLSKADEGKLTAKRSDVDLRQLVVADIFDELEISARTNEVTLRSSLEVERISADRDLLRRTLANLVENAIRHAPANTAVTVSARALEHAIEIRVADEGAGVPAEMRQRIFDPYVQLEDQPEGATRGGRGLGLTFCKLAVEAHEGSIAVDDGRPGAVFTLRIPDDR